MVEIVKRMIRSQMEAALRMVEACVEQCPEERWNEPVCNLAYCQAVFHVLFFTDCYLGANTAALREQPFHQEHPEFFRDYEELQDKAQEQLYDRPAIHHYLQHCYRKLAELIAAETETTLAAPCGFEWLKFSRAELYLYNLRHIQHHAAQLSLRLRLDSGEGVKWVRAGG
ncbi:MAG: hypothetical protein HJJLKODD_02485 [Phycisphaerae bacterium]|nr:hypothetical protein [Phycisphaerae bacterium]